MVKLFVNGDSHTARVYGQEGPTATDILARTLACEIENIALPGGSNQRIIRTTQEKLVDLDPAQTIIIIGWTSFERTEWYHNGHWHAICGDPKYAVDEDLTQSWQAHIRSYNHGDRAERCRRHQEQHNSIFAFHRLLHGLGYQMIFYQACAYHFFANCPHEHDIAWRLPWMPDVWAHDPYAKIENDSMVVDGFSHHSARLGFTPADDRAHYGADAHAAWAKRLLPILQSKLSKLS